MTVPGALEAFRLAMEKHGLVPPAEILADGEIHRCGVRGKVAGTAGSYLLHDDEQPAGGFRNWREDPTWQPWSYTTALRPLAPAERIALKLKSDASRLASEKEAKERHSEAAARAIVIWDEADAIERHPYLQRKKIKPHGTRVHEGRLVIPLKNKDRQLRSLQRIDHNGSKRYLPGGEVKGCYFVIGSPTPTVCIGEGFATMATIHEATGHACVVAFDAGNLDPVAKVIREKRPDAKIILCADDDHKTPGNPGLTRARAAASSIGGTVTLPQFPADRADDHTDFNDMAAAVGLEAVRRLILGEPEAPIPLEPPAADGAVPVTGTDMEEILRRRPPAPLADGEDPLARLVECAAVDPGAAFAPEVLACFATLKKEDPAAFETLRSQLKKVGVRVGQLDQAIAGANGDTGKRETQADILIKLAQAAELFHAPNGDGFADIDIKGHRETWPVRAKGFRRWLTRRYFEETKGAPSSEALQSALNVVESMAAFDKPERAVHLRVGGLDDCLYVDLCDEAWRAIEIGADGWRVIESPPVRFRRAAGMQPLPLPERGGSIEVLRDFLNVQGDGDFVVVVSWLLAALRSHQNYPSLVLSGEQGSAKSTFSAIIRALVDPNTAALRALPREDRDLFIAANNGHVLAFDNISGLPNWISDTLARLSTGAGFSSRQLYSDSDEVIFSASRPIILNGIEDIATRPDLAERALLLTLEPIPEVKRRSEAKIWAEFNAARPLILGVLMDSMVEGLKRLPGTSQPTLPRMADFALWATACETALWPAGTFASAYAGNRDAAVDDLIDGDPVASAVRALVSDGVLLLTKDATSLLAALANQVGDKAAKDKAWPANARALAGRLRRVQTVLRKVGIEISYGREGKARTRTITIENVRAASTAASTSVPETTQQSDESSGDWDLTSDAGGPPDWPAGPVGEFPAHFGGLI